MNVDGRGNVTALRSLWKVFDAAVNELGNELNDLLSNKAIFEACVVQENMHRNGEKMAEMQKKIEDTEIEGSSGGGAVKVLMNGKHELKKINIDPSLMNSEEKEVLEDLIVAAINDVNKKIAENMSNQLGSLSGGMGLPPGMKLPF